MTGHMVVLGCLPVHPGTLAFPGLVHSGNGASGPSWPLEGEQGSHGAGMDVNADPLQGGLSQSGLWSLHCSEVTFRGNRSICPNLVHGAQWDP